MESAVANLVRPGEPALVASLRQVRRALGGALRRLRRRNRAPRGGLGQQGRPRRARRAGSATNAGVELVFTTLSETSTGVVNDVRELAEVAHRHGALIAVDAVSALGAVPLPAGRVGRRRGRRRLAEGADGAARARLRERRTRRRSSAPRRARARRYYFDWQRTVAGQRKDPPDSPFTPAVGLVRALDVALGLIEEEGLDAGLPPPRAARAAPPARPRRALELELLGGDDEDANVVTAIALPEASTAPGARS